MILSCSGPSAAQRAPWRKWRRPAVSSIYRADENDTTAHPIGLMANPLNNRPILKMNGIGNEILVLDLRGADATVAA